MGDEDSEVTAYASQEDTYQAILAVLHQRREYLQSNNITNTSHVLTAAERADMVKLVRGKYESSEDQLRLQHRDGQMQRGKGKGHGKAHAGGAAQPTRPGSVANHVREGKRGRWCLHLQRICGTKVIWEVLAYTAASIPSFSAVHYRSETQGTYPQPHQQSQKQRAASSTTQKMQRRQLTQRAKTLTGTGQRVGKSCYSRGTKASFCRNTTAASSGTT